MGSAFTPCCRLLDRGKGTVMARTRARGELHEQRLDLGKKNTSTTDATRSHINGVIA